MNRYLFAMIVVAVLTGCQMQRARVITEEDFPNTVKLKAEEITFDRNRYDVLYVVDLIMLAFRSDSDDVFIDAYQLPSLDHLGVVARYGRGPGEFLHALYKNNNYYYEDGELKILVFDQLRTIASIVNLSQTIAQQKTIIEREAKFTKDVYVPFLVDINTLLLEESVFQEDRSFYLYDWTKKEYRDIGPILGKYDLSRLYAYSNTLELLPEDRHKAILHYYSTNRLSVQEISESGNTLLHGPYSIFSKSLRPSQIASDETAKSIYNDIRIVDNDVYCLYMNQTFEETINVPQPVEIHLFDGQLNPKTRYLVDEHIRFIAVDNINKTIYGVTADDEYYRYILP